MKCISRSRQGMVAMESSHGDEKNTYQNEVPMDEMVEMVAI